LVCAIDADTLIEPDALLRMVRPFVEDPEVVAAGGNIRVANGCKVRGGRVVEPKVPRRALPGFQMVEYTRAFLVGRMGLNKMGGNLVISGAFGLFRRDSLIAAGGYSTDTIGEDMELVLRLRRKGMDVGGPSKAEFIPDPVAWTEVPENFGSLGRQRDRWHRGLAQSMMMHKRVLFRPRYKAMGSAVYPYFLFIELMAPLVEFLGLLGLVIGLSLGVLDVRFALLFLVFAYGYGLLLTSMAVSLDEITFRLYPRLRDKAWFILWVLLEQFGYRQVTVYWRMRGLVKYALGHHEWGAMERKGFQMENPRQPVA
jgi:cellulose synthase/poly-beta-1,6-N-acetylglucosamine synthase-like glycosyltransferase